MEDARSVAFRLRIPYYVFNFSDEFRCQVMDRFADAYEQGRTPIPHRLQQPLSEIPAAYDRAALMCCDAIVTGPLCPHQAGKRPFSPEKGLDSSKDRNYVLYMLTRSSWPRSFRGVRS